MVKANNKIVKNAILAYGILASVVNVSMCKMSEEEFNKAVFDCLKDEQSYEKALEKADKYACQKLINDGLDDGWGILEQCNEYCSYMGHFYLYSGRFKEAISYYERVIALQQNNPQPQNDWVLFNLGLAYSRLGDYYHTNKYYEIVCNKGNEDFQAVSCYNLGQMYRNGEGVRQDYAKARELYKKACDMKYAFACNNLGVLYHRGQGVRQNLSTAKQYYGKSCDLGGQIGCDNYKELNNRGVQ